MPSSIIRNPASESSGDTTYKPPGASSRTKSALWFIESWEAADLWVSEYVLTYDDQPFYTVSIMEFRGVKVAHETQYFADPFEASDWRKKWVENMDSPKNQGSPEGTFAG